MGLGLRASPGGDSGASADGYRDGRHQEPAKSREAGIGFFLWSYGVLEGGVCKGYVTQGSRNIPYSSRRLPKLP